MSGTSKTNGRLGIIICLLVFLGTGATAQVSASEPIAGIAPPNPEYLAFQQSEIEDTEHPTGFVPPSLDLSHLDGSDLLSASVRDQAPSAYDLRTLGKMTSVKNQNPWGTCWAFASLGSLESGLKPNITADFSEKNVVNRNLWRTGPNDGGHYLMSGGYLAAGMGPVNETDDPYPSGSWNFSSPEGPRSYPLKEIIWLPARQNLTDTATLKWGIYTYGGLHCSFYWSSSAWNSSSNGYYYSTGNSTNHAIVLAGWDDSYSRNNFTTPAPGDGAFLFKNSWGTGWGDQGYGWISYHDTSLGKYNTAFIGAEQSDLTPTYQYDPAGPSTSFGNPNLTDIWGANVFNVTSNGTLSAAGFYTNDIPTSYLLRVYKNPVNGPVGNEVASQKTGMIPMSGYHIVPLTATVPLTAGDRFSIVIHLDNPAYEYPLLIEYPEIVNKPVNWTASPGQGYYSSNGTGWEDMTERYPNTSICIKGYTEQSPSPTPTVTPTASPTQSPSPTQTITPTASPTQSPSPTPTATPTPTPTPVRSHLINATSNQLGYIYPSGMVRVDEGNNITFRFQARPGAAIANVTLDGSPVTIQAGNTYTLQSVNTSHDIALNCSVKSKSIIAGLTANTTTGSLPLTVQFNDTTLGNPTRWYWTFGDGGWSDAQNPVHTYTKSGSWTVRLWARNSWSSGIMTKKGFIRTFGDGTPMNSEEMEAVLVQETELPDLTPIQQ